MAVFASGYAQGTVTWQPVPLPNFLSSNKGSIVEFAPWRMYSAYRGAAGPSQLNDLLFLQLRNSLYPGSLSSSYGWEIDGIDLEFIP